MKKPKMNMRTGMPTIEPAQIIRYSDGLSLRSARAISRARFAPKSRRSTTLLRLASAWLWAMQVADAGPARSSAAASPSARPEA